MYKAMTLATVLIGLALAPVLSDVRGEADNRPSHSIEVVDASVTATDEQAAEELSCEWSCGACEPGQNCTQMCMEIGDCGDACGVTARCEAGYRWDNQSCSCSL